MARGKRTGHRLLAQVPVGAAIPDDHRAGAVLALADHALEVAPGERMVVDGHREALLARVGGGPLGHGPRLERALHLQAEVPVHRGGVVLLDHEAGHPSRPDARAEAALSPAGPRGGPRPGASCGRCRSARAAASRAGGGATACRSRHRRHVRRQRREARRDLPHVQVVDLDHAGAGRPARGRSRRGRCPRGAASSRTRPESRSSPQPERSISAATSSAAIPSAGSKPVVRIRTPAIAVAMNANRSVSTCWKAPSTLRLRRSAPRQRPGRGEVDNDAGERDHEHRPRPRRRAVRPAAAPPRRRSPPPAPAASRR